MRCVLVGPVYPYRGGIAHYTTMLAQAIAKRYPQFHVVSFRRQYPRWLYPGKSDRDPSQETFRSNAEYLLDPFYPWTWWQTVHRIVKWNPDLVVFQWWTTFWAPAFGALAFLLRQRGMKVLFVIHNVMPHEPRPWDRWLTKLVLGQAAKFLVMTGREQDRLLDLLPQAHVTVASLPVFDMFAEQHIQKDEARKRLALPEGIPIALFFGLVRPYKGLEFLIEAVARLNERGMRIFLVVAGEFWEDRAAICLEQIERLGLSSQVKIDNRYIPNSEVGLYFSATDMFVAPYVDGTQSAAVKVALGFNLPIVISQAIASEELENDVDHRLYWVAPKDVDSLAEAIDLCLQENDQMKEFFTPQVSGDGWEKLVDKIEALIYPKPQV